MDTEFQTQSTRPTTSTLILHTRFVSFLTPNKYGELRCILYIGWNSKCLGVEFYSTIAKEIADDPLCLFKWFGGPEHGPMLNKYRAMRAISYMITLLLNVSSADTTCNHMMIVNFLIHLCVVFKEKVSRINVIISIL